MKKSFMTRILATGLSFAMAFSMAAVTSVTPASAASKPVLVDAVTGGSGKAVTVNVGEVAKLKVNAATSKTYAVSSVKKSSKKIKTSVSKTGTVVYVRGVAETGEKDSAIRVSFKVKKTGKTSKYTFAAKVTVVAPEEPTTPTTAAIKITEAKATSATVVTAKFDGAVDTASASSIKLSRGTTDIDVKSAWSDDKTTLTLTASASLAAGTYTLTVGTFDPISFAVVKQTPTTLVISNDTVANKVNAKVSFQVQDQYGNDMNYQDKKLTVTAYNTTKGHAIDVGTTNGKNYFTLSCSTQYNDQNAVGDSISIVAYLTGNAAVSATKTVKISNIYTDEFTFGDIKLGDAARVTINGTYEIEYTAKDSEGNAVTLDKPVSVTAWKDGVRNGTPKHTTSDLTFISSNPSAVDVDDFEITTDGKLKFTAGGTDGTAIITAINNQTGKSTNITIKVNKKPVASSVEVADASIASNTSAGTAKVKAAVTVYDQFGEVMPVANCKNLNITSSMDLSYTPAGYITVEPNITGDGKYIVYDVSYSLSTLEGQTIVTTFTSKNAGETGYIKSTASLEVSDKALPASISVNAAPALSKVAGEKTDFKFAVKDQYGNEMTGTAVSNAGFTLVVTDPQKVFDENDKTIVAPAANKEYKHTFTAQNPGTDLHKSGVVTLSLVDDNDNVVSKVSYTVDAVTAPTKYVVNADKKSYTAGDEATITVEAYSSTQFNNYYNADVAAKVEAGRKTYTTTLKFVNGSATYKLKLVDAAATEVIVTNIANGITTTSDDASNFTVNAGGVAKLNVTTTGQAIVADAAGTTVESYSGAKVVTFKVEDLTLSSDITGACTWGSTLFDDNTLNVTFTDGKTGSALPTVTLPDVNRSHTIKITVTIEGVSYSQTLTGDAGAHTIGADSWT